MDKNKNRTDLLAAGRKRLQQFRKKKGGEGNKSSGKASNSEVESDADSVSADKAELVPPQILDQEGSLKNEPDAQNAAFLVPSSEDQNQTIAINDHLSAPPVIPDTDSDTTSLARNVELLPEENVSTELSVGNDQTFDSLSPHHVKDMNVVEEPSSNDSRSLECVVSEDDSAHSAVLGVEDSSNQEYFVDTTESVRVDGADQVTDIGAIQRGDYLALQQMIKDNEVVVKDEGAIQGGDYLALQQMIKDNEVVVKDDGMLGLPGSGETVERTAGMSKGETNMEDPNSGVCSRIDIIDVLVSSSESNEVKEVPELLQGTLILPPSEPLTVTADISRVIDEDKRSYSQSLLPDSHVIERIKEQLYLMTCAGDIDRTQLAEESKLQVDFDQEHRQVLLEVSSAANSVTKVRWMNKILCEELAKCKSDLEAAVDVKNKLETQFNAEKSELVEITIRAEGLHVELERSHEASTRQLAEIAGYKNLVSGLQAEIDTLNGNLTSSVDSENKLTEDMLVLRRENEKLLATLVECKDSLKSFQVERANLNDNLVQTSQERRKIEDVKDGIACENDKLLAELKECKALLDVVQVENDTLNRNIFSALETNKELAEEKSHFSTQSEKLSLELAHYKDLLTGLQLEHCNALNELKEAKCVIEERLEDNIRLSLPREEKMKLSPSHLNDPEPPFVLIDLKGQLEEAEKLIKLLDNTIENIHSHSMYLGTSSRKTVAPVSKLIQAFESKVHHDDCDEEVVSSSENKIHVYSILSAKEQLNSLGNVFKELMRYSMDAITYQKNLADVPLEELNVSYEALKEHCDSCEAKSIENVVLSELFKLHWIENIEAQKVELLGLYDTIRQHSTNVEVDNIKLVSRIGVCQSRTVELEKKIEEMLISSDEVVLSVTKKVDVLYTEVAERDLNHDQVIQSVRQLNVLVGSPCCSKTLETVSNDLDLVGFVTVSIDAATDFIKNLQEDLEACKIDQETLKSSYMDLVGKCNDVRGKNELATDVLHHLRSKLNKIVLDASSTAFEENNQIMEESENFLDTLHIYNYDSLVEQITVLLNGRLQLESENHKLRSELIYRENLVEELKKRSLDSDVILHLIEDVEGKLKLDGSCFDSDKLETHLQYLISFLFQKYEEADDELCLSRESSISHGVEISLLEGKIESLRFVVAQHENEIIVLKESLRQGREAFVALEAELQGKINEVDQSEQRVSSIREKLSIAVSKGKGLIVQRDSLKQSLAETSSELDRYLKELQLKDSMLEEVEAKLKTYSEAGERVEALESELSYIRNSATALRESFISKDSVLQRIEEMLEDLELPENLYSRDIIEKVDWLARSVAGNALLPLTTNSYTDAVVVGDDSWKEDVHGLDNNDLRKKYEELQSKFYGLAEQNDMLEQSLLERNNVVQRWEEMIDRVNMPLQLRSMEPEDRIEWLANALSASHQHCDSLQQKVDHLETCYNAVTADLDQSHTRVTDLDTALQAITIEKNHLLQNLDSVTSNYDRALETVAKLEFENDKLQNEATALQEKLLVKVNDFEMENTKLQNEVTALQENLVEKVRSCQLIEGEIKRLEDLVSSVLQDGDLLTNGSKGLGQLLQKLVEQYSTLALQNTAVSVTKGGNTITEEEAGAINVEQRAKEDDIVGVKDVNASRDELEAALCALVRVKEERDKYLEMNQSLVREVEALDSKEQELQELLRQEEQKSVSVREKLNVAVRKGKSLVQHRDSLKQAIEELNSEVERLKSDIKIQEISHVDYEQKVKDLSSNKERVEVLESEIMGLKNLLQEKTRTLSMIVDTLNGFDVTLKNVVDPLEKLNIISKRWQELHVASENNFNKAKRSAELLVAELNEVQERNDLLQEELSQVHHDISELSTARDFAEASKHEAILQLEKLSSLHYNERNSQLVELFAIKSCLTELIDSFYNVNDIVGTVLYKQVEYLYNLETSLKSSLEPNSADVGVVSLGDPRSLFPINSENRENLFLPNSLSESEMQKCVDGNKITEVCGLVGSHMQVFLKEVNVLKEEFYKHSVELEKRAKHLSKVGSSVCREVISQKQFIIENSIRLENIEKERDEESIAMRKNLSLLFEACSSSVLEIENWKSQFVGSSLTTEDIQRYDSSIDLLSSGECCRTLADKLSFSVKELINFQTEIVEGVYKDMKVTITNLQKELQEKDIQKDRICVEFVSQIREAESAARSHLQDSKLAKSQLDDVKRRLEVIEEESNLLKQRIQEFEDDDTLKELDERARSLNSVLVAKEQEIEALMQALDEEERQMEEQTNKILELEIVMQQKNSELENMEASSVKVKKKLSVTVSKFDELHHLSRSLLSEVEKLQCGVRERDEEISFLRQEVTRCTNDALSDKRNSSEEMLHDLVTWLKSVYPGNIEKDPRNEMNINNNYNYKELLHNQIGALLSQLEDLKAMVQSKDMMLQVEKAKVEDLMRKGESLENTLRNKDSQLSRNSLGNRGWMDSSTSEIVEAEPLMNTWSVTGTSIAPQVRTLRKANNDQVAIAIDTNNDSGNKLENDDDDDDKAHGFKSLTTSRIVPRFSRPVTDMIDGLWVSCDRTLMRQPALRLGVIIYWAVMHALLATFVV